MVKKNDYQTVRKSRAIRNGRREVAERKITVAVSSIVNQAGKGKKLLPLKHLRAVAAWQLAHQQQMKK